MTKSMSIRVKTQVLITDPLYPQSMTWLTNSENRLLKLTYKLERCGMVTNQTTTNYRPNETINNQLSPYGLQKLVKLMKWFMSNNIPKKNNIQHQTTTPELKAYKFGTRTYRIRQKVWK